MKGRVRSAAIPPRATYQKPRDAAKRSFGTIAQTTPSGLKAPKRGDKFGHWRLERFLGRGGNGEVWLALHENGDRGAIKILRKTKQSAYARFRDEVKALKLTSGIEGVLPLWDEHLPEDPQGSHCWYVTPVAIPLMSLLYRLRIREKVRAIAEVAETMAKLHAKRIAHRDIKPGNLLMYQNRCYVGDFGLVDYPDKPDITAPREQLGPRWTMAPEVRRDGWGANPFPGDVYSLGKTLWMVLTGETKGFDGQYDARSELSISRYCGEMYVTPLEELLSSSTDHNPEERPTMRDFAARLRKWLRISSSYQDYNPLQWSEVQKRLFPLSVPTRAVWEDIGQILVILNTLGAASSLNHLFFPDGGGLDLERAVRSKREPGCIELITGNYASIVKPLRLVFESFHDDPQWNYFRLETGGLSPTGVYEDYETDDYYEDLTDVGGKVYASSSCWDDGEYKGKKLPKGSRPLCRYFRGAFAIFQKTSIYNQEPGTYDGRHEQMSADEFRAYIAEQIEALKESTVLLHNLKT